MAGACVATARFDDDVLCWNLWKLFMYQIGVLRTCQDEYLLLISDSG